jgi:hypothetical protein
MIFSMAIGLRNPQRRFYECSDMANAQQIQTVCSIVLRLICVQRKDRKTGILNRQNEMLETLCSLFPIDCRLPKLNVAGSIPVSRSRLNRRFHPFPH